MRKFMNIINESLAESPETEPMAPDASQPTIKAGDFVQLGSWFSDVWAYVIYVGKPVDGKWMIQYPRRGKYGQADKNDIVISALDNPAGYHVIKKVITYEDLKHELSKSSWINVTLPQFKFRDGNVWKDGENIGSINHSGKIFFKNGETSTLDAEVEKAHHLTKK